MILTRSKAISFSRIDLSLPVILAAVCLLSGLILRLIAVGPLSQEPVTQAPFNDDGYYYLEIARNFARTGVFTFDGIHRTNGFHPLWALLLVPLALFTGDSTPYMRLVLYLGIALYALTGLLLFRFTSRYGGKTAGLAAVVLWSFAPDLIIWQNQGMENSIFLPLMLASLLQLDRFQSSSGSSRDAWLLGVLFGLTMWSRSDSVLFVLLALLDIAIPSLKAVVKGGVRSGIKDIFRPVLITGLAVFVFGLGYLLFNLYAAGSILSVSMTVKLGDSTSTGLTPQGIWQAVRLHIAMLAGLFDDTGGLFWLNLNWRLLPFKVFALLWILFAAGWWLKSASRGVTWKRFFPTARMPALFLLFLYTTLHSLILVTVLGSILRWTPWYIVPQVVAITVGIPLLFFHADLILEVEKRWRALLHLARRFLPNQNLAAISNTGLKKVAILAGFAGFIIFPGLWALSVPVQGWQQMALRQQPVEPRYELAIWLRENTPQGKTVGMFDAGMVGYFSDRPVINLDGLVNSPDFLAVRRSGRYAQYVTDSRLDYLIYYDFPPYTMEWGPLAGESRVCHRLVYVNRNPALWGADRVNNYFQVIEMRYDRPCSPEWKAGFPRAPLAFQTAITP